MGHPLNWFGGWSLIGLAFVTGAVIGLGFHREDFLGGYASFRRRIIRLGHIALAALGLMNVAYGLSPVPVGRWGEAASLCLLGGAVAMPLVCFLTGWRAGFRQLFFVPVMLLVAAIVFILIGGVS
jgi:hypothetical protein